MTVLDQLISDDVYLESISVFQKPSKTTYEQNQAFDLTGLIVIGTYSNGLNTLFLDYTTDLENGTVLSELGTHTVTVSRGTITTTFTITVVEEIIYGNISEIKVSVADESDVEITVEDSGEFATLSVNDDFVSYEWRVNSLLVGVEKEFIFNKEERLEGVYEIFLKVKDANGLYKSATIYVQVEE